PASRAPTSTLLATTTSGAAAASRSVMTTGAIRLGAAATIVRGGTGGRSDVRPSFRGGFGILRVKFGDALSPHADKVGRGDSIDVFPDAFDGRKRIAPDRAFAPLLALFLAFVRRAHRSPGKAARLAQVFHRAFDALLVNEINIVKGRRPVREHLEHDVFRHELQCGGDGVIPRIEDVAGAVHFEFFLAQLEQADIRPGALLGVEAGLDLCNRLHESEVESQEVGYPLDFIDRCPWRDAF